MTTLSRGRFAHLNVVRKRRKSGELVEYFYHKPTNTRLHNRPGTAAFAAEYDRADRVFGKLAGKPRPTYVYFAEMRARGIVKIGKATSPKRRLTTLQTSAADHLRLAGIVFDASGGALESELHKRFAHLRVRGEWFQMKDEIKAFIAEHARAT